MENVVLKQLKLGLFVISATILFIAAVYFIGVKQNIFGNTYQIYGIFKNIGGLKAGNNVRFSGINVGTVKDVKMVSDTLIIVKIAIQKDIIQHIKTDATCSITTDGLVGSMIINIIPGMISKSSMVEGDTIRSFSKVSTDEMLQTLSTTNQNTALLTSELLALTKEVRSGKGVVGALLNDTLLENDIRQIINELKKTSKISTSTISKIDRTIASLDGSDKMIGVLKDPVMASKIKNVISNTEKSSEALDRILMNLDSTMKNVNQTVINAKDGKGVINHLSNDPGLVLKIDNTIQNLDSTIIQINKASIKLNENLDALKRTWLLRGYFKKYEKSKEK